MRVKSQPYPLHRLCRHARVAAPATAQSNDTLQKTKENGAITIGARDSQLPFSYKPAGNAEPVGFTNDICLKIIDAVKAKLNMPNLAVRYQMLNSTNRIPLLQNGTVDLDCATTTNTVARQHQVAFAPSHFVTNITAAVKKDDTVTGLMTSGAIDAIYAKWFTRPIPPANANLNFPMTDAVREVFRNPNNKGV